MTLTFIRDSTISWDIQSSASSVFVDSAQTFVEGDFIVVAMHMFGSVEPTLVWEPSTWTFTVGGSATALTLLSTVEDNDENLNRKTVLAYVRIDATQTAELNMLFGGDQAFAGPDPSADVGWGVSVFCLHSSTGATFIETNTPVPTHDDTHNVAITTFPVANVTDYDVSVPMAMGIGLYAGGFGHNGLGWTEFTGTWDGGVGPSSYYVVPLSGFVGCSPEDTDPGTGQFTFTDNANPAEYFYSMYVVTYGFNEGVVEQSSDILSTVATIDHDLLIGVEEDQHHVKTHAITDESHHPGGYVYKTGRHPQIEDADVLAAGVLAISDGQVGVTYDTQTGETLLWNRLNGVWAAVEVTE